MKSQASLWDNEYFKHENKWHFETKSIPGSIKNKSVLELGAGTGKTLKAILRKKPKQVIAIDFSAQSAKILNNIKNEDLKVVKADVKILPFKDSYFDAVFCCYILNNMEEKERKKAVKEIYRVLKNGGSVFFEDFALGDFREKSGKDIGDHTTEKKNGIICHFFSIKELISLFKIFRKKKFVLKSTKPITHKPSLNRKIVTGIIRK